MIKSLLEQNRNWAAQRVAEDPDYFNRLVAVQRPKYLWIGCSDSRVPANAILGLESGEIFVHRNVANVVHPTDLNCLTTVQYAVDVLKITDIMIGGHYGCGGVIAAYNQETYGLLPYWLRPIASLAVRERDALERLEDPEERTKLLCELNVKEQVFRLCQTPIIQDAWAKGVKLAVHGLIYSLTDGLLKDLNCTRTSMDEI